jgi:hypothetical protein
MRNGGRRPGAGRPKGSKSTKTLEKEAAREFVRQVVTDHLESLLAAQIDNAVGLKHLMMRDTKTGRFERVTGDAEQLDKALQTDTRILDLYERSQRASVH